jgi:LA2681-like HEPN/Phasin protein
MKQEFASARWLLYEGITARTTHFSDRQVRLSNTLDYPSYGLAVEKLKAAEALPVEHPAIALQTESRAKHNDPKQDALLVEHPATALQTASPPKHNDPEQEALLVENPATALQDDCKRTMTESKKALGFSLAAANVRAYQAKLLEMAQANMQFAFEFAQRLATIRSPVEFPSVIAEFTNRRIAMFQRYSKEMAEFSALR